MPVPLDLGSALMILGFTSNLVVPRSDMPSRAVVAIGASAGGVEALSEVVAGLPPDLPAAVLVVLHVLPGADSHLPSILERAGRLPAHHAVDGGRMVDGAVFVPPPGGHRPKRD